MWVSCYVREGRLVCFKHWADRVIVFIKHGVGRTIESHPKSKIHHNLLLYLELILYSHTIPEISISNRSTFVSSTSSTGQGPPNRRDAISLSLQRKSVNRLPQ